MLLCSGFYTGTHAHKDLIRKMTYKMCIVSSCLNVVVELITWSLDIQNVYEWI